MALTPDNVALPGRLPEQLDAYGESTLTHLLRGQKISAVSYLWAQQQRNLFSSEMLAVLQHVDAFLLPTLPIADIPAEQISQDISIDGVPENAGVAVTRLIVPFNLTGQPAISFPCGFTAKGLPISMQLVGRLLEELVVLRITHTYQQVTNWHERGVNEEQYR